MLALRSRLIAVHPVQTGALVRTAVGASVARPILQSTAVAAPITHVGGGLSTYTQPNIAMVVPEPSSEPGKIKEPKPINNPKVPSFPRASSLSSSMAQSQQSQSQSQSQTKQQKSQDQSKGRPKDADSGGRRFFSTETRPNIAMVKPEPSATEPGKIKEPHAINNPTSNPKPEMSPESKSMHTLKSAEEQSKDMSQQQKMSKKPTDTGASTPQSGSGRSYFSTYAQTHMEQQTQTQQQMVSEEKFKPAPISKPLKSGDEVQPNHSRAQEAQEHLPVPALEDDFLVYHDMTLEEIIAHKPRTATFSIEEDQTIFEAIKLMSEKHVGCLMVTSKGQTVGIVTERDYLRKVALKNLSSRDTPVHKIMCTEVKYGTGSQSARDAMKLMTEGRFRHLPVLNDRRELIGLVSIGDLVKSILSEVSETAMYYRDFIEGKYRYSGNYMLGHLKNLPTGTDPGNQSPSASTVTAGQPTPGGPSMASSN